MYYHKSIQDDLSLVGVANEIVGFQPDRKNSFGRFTNKDIKEKHYLWKILVTDLFVYLCSYLCFCS